MSTRIRHGAQVRPAVTRTAPKCFTPDLPSTAERCKSLPHPNSVLRNGWDLAGRAAVRRVNSSQAKRLYTEVATTAGQGVERTTPEFNQLVDFHQSGAARLPERIDLPAISNFADEVEPYVLCLVPRA